MGKYKRIVGTNRDDSISVRPNLDTLIHGKNGDDAITDNTRRGVFNTDDFLFGDDGNDMIGSYGGMDHLDGGMGNDRLYSSGFASVTLDGGKGKDIAIIAVDGDLSLFENHASHVRRETIDLGYKTVELTDVEKVKFVDLNYDWPY